MKDLWKSGILLLIVIGCLYMIYLRECRHPLPVVAADEMVIKKATWDSIKSLADKPPIVKHDTIKGDTVYLPPAPLPTPKPDPADTTIVTYRDSIYNMAVNVWYDFKIKENRVIWRRWSYVPITVRIDNTVFVPKIVDNLIEVPVSKSGLYVYGTFGGNASSFLFGGGIDYINKKDNTYGYMYQRFGNLNFHSFKIGAKIRF